MGNAHFKLIEDNTNLPIDQSFLQKYQKHVTTVDQTLIGLARGIDSLQTTCQLFFHQYSKSTDGQGEDVKASTSEEAVILILRKIHECISNNKDTTIQSMKNLFSFIQETGKVFVENADEAFSSLSVNTYQSLLPENEFQDSLFIDFYKKRNEHLKKEIESLQKESKIQQDLIEALKKHESCLLDNKELKNQIKDWIEQNSHKKERSEGSSLEGALLLSTPAQANTFKEISIKESALENVQGINILNKNMAFRKESIDYQAMPENILADLRRQIQLLEEENSRMRREQQEKPITTQLSTKKVMVQVYSRYYYTSIKEPEEDLLVRLGTELSKRDVDLKVIRCKRTSQTVDSSPVLLTINHNVSHRKNITIETAMEGLEYTQNKAVVVFHQKEDRDLPNELKLYEKQYKSLGRVIHFSYKSSLHTTVFNKESLEYVIEFIERFGTVHHKVVETRC